MATPRTSRDGAADESRWCRGRVAEPRRLARRSHRLNGGAPSSVWYDRVGGFEPRYPEQTPSVERSAKQVLDVIDAAVKRGVPPSKIAVGGFSMGGNLAYQTAARYHADASRPPLGAIFGLSCYMTDDSKAHDLIAKSGAAWPPVYVAHGAADDFILPQWGRATFDRVKGAGVDAFWRSIPGARHEMTSPEMAEVVAFLKGRLNLPAADGL